MKCFETECTKMLALAVLSDRHSHLSTLTQIGDLPEVQIFGQPYCSGISPEVSA